MTSLLGHGGTNGTSPLLCALERGHAELQDERIRARDAALSPEVRQLGMGIWFAGHCTDGIARKRVVCRP